MRNKECNCEESRSQQPLRSGMWNTGTLTYDIRITMTPPIAECRSSCRVSPRVTTVATTSFNNEIEEFFSGPASLPRPDLSGLNKIKKTEAKKETDREKDKDGRCNFVRTLSSQTMKASVPVLFFFYSFLPAKRRGFCFFGIVSTDSVSKQPRILLLSFDFDRSSGHRTLRLPEFELLTYNQVIFKISNFGFGNIQI